MQTLGPLIHVETILLLHIAKPLVKDLPALHVTVWTFAFASVSTIPLGLFFRKEWKMLAHIDGQVYFLQILCIGVSLRRSKIQISWLGLAIHNHGHYFGYSGALPVNFLGHQACNQHLSFTVSITPCLSLSLSLSLKISCSQLQFFHPFLRPHLWLWLFIHQWSYLQLPF